MLQFLQPSALFAITGILLPVAIHLWNKREGKILKIGSVLLLSETARQQARSLKLNELILLLLRCLVIVLLAMLMAQPVWQKQLNAKDKKGWIVLDPQKESYKKYQPVIDSLLLAGFEAHLFTQHFPIVNLKNTLLQNNPADTLPYWALLKALNEQVPAELPIYFFTGNRLKRFSGDRPLIDMDIKWHTYSGADTTTGNLLAARLLATDSIEAIVAKSMAAYSSYTTENISSVNPAPAYKLLQSGTGYRLAVAANTNNAVAVDTTVLRVAIYTDHFLNDAKYLEAAINAIRQYGHYRMDIKVITDPQKLPADPDWLFWLSQKEVPGPLLKNNVFVYESGKEKAIQSRLVAWQRNSNADEEISLFKCVVNANTTSTGKIIWSNGYGEPVLIQEQSNATVFHFYSRFDPAWTGLVWSEHFPRLLFELLINKPIENIDDYRTLDNGQIEPVRLNAGEHSVKQKFIETIDLSKWAWAFAFVLFAVERIISFNQKKEAHAAY